MGLVISGLRGSGFRALRLSIQDFQSLGIVFPDFRCGMKGSGVVRPGTTTVGACGYGARFHQGSFRVLCA